MQTPITPVAVYPGTANTLYIRSVTLGPPPSYYYELQAVEVVPGAPATKSAPATPDTTKVVVLKNGNVDMTQAQWAAWSADADDDEVQLNAISANLGLTRV